MESVVGDQEATGGLSRPLHRGFYPVYRWMRSYGEKLRDAGSEVDELRLFVTDPTGKGSSIALSVLPHDCGKSLEADATTRRWVERVVKMLLWQRGGCDVWLSDRVDLLEHLQSCYRPGGIRAFDAAFFSERVYHRPLRFHLGVPKDPVVKNNHTAPVAKKAKGCRIGYDLGGSDRKCAAVVDGEVVFSEEIPWAPYHQTDPMYHLEGIRDSLHRAAAHLPRVDAIGGSSAGVIIDHVPEVGSLFRGLDEQAMQQHIRPFFKSLSKEWGGIPVTLLNDGEVTALAGANWLGKTGVLGIAMGTSLASGYVDPSGQVGHFLNELAFCPVDMDPAAPADEWSGDIGCGVQYFSQQAVFRLAAEAGIRMPDGLSLSERLRYVQDLAEKGHQAALQVFRRIGQYLGETIPFWKQFYEFDQLLLLGRVVSGVAGDCIVSEAQRILDARAGDPNGAVEIHVPDETFKRHGQAIVASAIPQTDPI